MPSGDKYCVHILEVWLTVWCLFGRYCKLLETLHFFSVTIFTAIVHCTAYIQQCSNTNNCAHGWIFRKLLSLMCVCVWGKEGEKTYTRFAWTTTLWTTIRLLLSIPFRSFFYKIFRQVRYYVFNLRRLYIYILYTMHTQTHRFLHSLHVFTQNFVFFSHRYILRDVRPHIPKGELTGECVQREIIL